MTIAFALSIDLDTPARAPRAPFVVALLTALLGLAADLTQLAPVVQMLA